MKVYIIGRRIVRNVIVGVIALFVFVFLILVSPIVQTVFKTNKILPIYNVQTNEKKVGSTFF